MKCYKDGQEVDSLVCSKLITVLIPVHNGIKTLENCLASTFSQSFEDYDILVVDDGSTDGTLEYLLNFPLKGLSVISQKKKGIVAALNVGLSVISSPYIARMDADDIMHNKRLQVEYDFLHHHPAYDLVATRMALFSGHPSNVFATTKVAGKVTQETLYPHNNIAHPTVLAKKEIFCDGYQVGTDGQEDHILWKKCFSEGRSMFILDEVLLLYRVKEKELWRFQ